MDDFHHKTYFADIGYNKDGNFNWRGDEWAGVMKGEYDRALKERIQGAKELETLQQLDTMQGETFIIYIDINAKLPSQPFKQMGTYFSIWHEFERGGYQGVHGFWWTNDNYIFIVNEGEEEQFKGGKKGRTWGVNEFRK